MDVIKLAKEAGMAVSTSGHYVEAIADGKDLQRFADLIKEQALKEEGTDWQLLRLERAIVLLQSSLDSLKKTK